MNSDNRVDVNSDNRAVVNDLGASGGAAGVSADIESGISRANTSISLGNNKECIVCFEPCDSKDNYKEVLDANGITKCGCNYILHYNCYIKYSNVYGNMCMICKKKYYQQYNSEMFPHGAGLDGDGLDGISRDGVITGTRYEHFRGAVNTNYIQGLVLNLTDQEQQYRRQFNGGCIRIRKRYYKQSAVCFLIILGITLYVVNFM